MYRFLFLLSLFLALQTTQCFHLTTLPLTRTCTFSKSIYPNNKIAGFSRFSSLGGRRSSGECEFEIRRSIFLDIPLLVEYYKEIYCKDSQEENGEFSKRKSNGFVEEVSLSKYLAISFGGNNEINNYDTADFGDDGYIAFQAKEKTEEGESDTPNVNSFVSEMRHIQKVKEKTSIKKSPRITPSNNSEPVSQLVPCSKIVGKIIGAVTANNYTPRGDVGSFGSYTTGKSYIIRNLHVLEGYRRKGVATTLLKNIEDEIVRLNQENSMRRTSNEFGRMMGAGWIPLSLDFYIEVVEGNRNAKTFYYKNGYQLANNKRQGNDDIYDKNNSSNYNDGEVDASDLSEVGKPKNYNDSLAKTYTFPFLVIKKMVGKIFRRKALPDKILVLVKRVNLPS